MRQVPRPGCAARPAVVPPVPAVLALVARRLPRDEVAHPLNR